MAAVHRPAVASSSVTRLNIGDLHFWPPPGDWEFGYKTMYLRLRDGRWVHDSSHFERNTSIEHPSTPRNAAVLAFWWEERERPLFEAMLTGKVPE